jgi:FkbM family methyltransferase
VSPTSFVSHAQNREDVVLWRALNSITSGRYVEVGANDPTHHSITRSFYDAGWRGLLIEPEPQFADRLRKGRPRDVVVEAAVTRTEGDVTLHRFPDTGLSTLDDSIRQAHDDHGWDGDDLVVSGRRLDQLVEEHGFSTHTVHFAVIDVEGAEADVLASVDLTKWRPWVLVIESTKPRTSLSSHSSWEPSLLAAGYRFCLFDGLSRFYVAEEHAEQLQDALSYPACALDTFTDARVFELEQQLVQSEATTLRWRHAALGSWASGVARTQLATNQASLLAGLNEEIDRLRKQLKASRKRAARDRAELRRTLRRADTSRTRFPRLRTRGTAT